MAVFGCGGLQDRASYHGVARIALHLPLLGPALARAQWRALGRFPGLLRTSLKMLLPTLATVPDELVGLVRAELAGRSDPTVFYRWQRDELGPHRLKTDLRARLGEIAAPVLMLHGGHDIAVPVAYARGGAGPRDRGPGQGVSGRTHEGPVPPATCPRPSGARAHARRGPVARSGAPEGTIAATRPPCVGCARCPRGLLSSAACPPTAIA